MPGFLRFAAILFVLTNLCLPGRLLAWGEGSLDKTLARMTRQLVKQGELEGAFVLINPSDLYDADTGLSLPLARQLRGKLTAEMRKNGVRVLLPGADEDQFMILQGTWQRTGKELSLDLKVMRLTEQGPEAVAAASERVPLSIISAESLKPDSEAWARYLVRKLEEYAAGHNKLSLHVSPFRNGGNTCADELANYLAGWLRPALSESPIYLPLDQQTAMAGLPVETLRTRGIGPQKKTEDHTSLTASLLDADAELKGESWLNDDKLEVRARIVDRQGVQVSAAAAQIPSDLFPPHLLKPAPRPFPGASAAPAFSGQCLVRNGLELELTTTKGEMRPFYREGEKLRFLLRLNRPAWVYLFDLNPRGEAVLLYPVDEMGSLETGNGAGFVRQIDKPLILPEDGYSFDLVAEPPFGTDRVLAVAAEAPLDLPRNLAGDWARADVLVERIRQQGLGGQNGYAEAQVELVTGK